MVVRRIFPGNPHENAARALYEVIVRQARQPEFYRDWGVPDTVDGRFELLVLHCFLVLRRLKSARGAVSGLSQTLFDTLIYDLDQSIRVSGVGDLGVGPRLRQMAEAFYGRISAYDGALSADDPEVLAGALARNVYGTVPRPEQRVVQQLTDYVLGQAAALEKASREDLEAGHLAFQPVSEVVGSAPVNAGESG